MPTDGQILILTQWLSPAYPVGAFAYSHGLEAAVDLGWVTDGPALEAWLEDVLCFGAGQADARLIAAAYLCGPDKDVAEIDAVARAFAASRERHFETDRMGAAFGTVTSAIWGNVSTALTFPVALGCAAASQAIPLDLTAKLYLQAFLSNLITAGQRLMPLGQTDAQAMLYRLTPKCARIAEAAMDGDLSMLSASSFLGDIAAMKHEIQYSRMFRT